MEEGYHLECTDTPEDAALTKVGFGIRDYNLAQAGPEGNRRLACILYAPDGSVAGGLVGSTYWNWLHIDWLWVEDALRGKGHGQALLARAEDEARARGAHNAYLDTFSFQAPDFYMRNGYQVFGVLRDFPAGHQRYFLQKTL